MFPARRSQAFFALLERPRQHADGGDGGALAQCIQDQLINSIDTVDRGVRERPDLRVLRHTAMPAVLVETAFIDNDVDVQLLINNWDDIARAIARGVTDYACGLR